MKLRTQILVLGLFGALLASVSGGMGLLGVSRLGGSIEGAIQAGGALQTSQSADMMHDAVRGDAQLAYLGALDKSPEKIAEAKADLADHAKTFDEAMSKLSAYPLTAESRSALTAAEPLVRKYIDSAARVISAASSDVEQAKRELPALQTVFSELEERMAALSESIEKNGTGVITAAQSEVKQTQALVLASLWVGAALIVMAALALARNMTRPMAHAVEVAGRPAGAWRSHGHHQPERKRRNRELAAIDAEHADPLLAHRARREGQCRDHGHREPRDRGRQP